MIDRDFYKRLLGECTDVLASGRLSGTALIGDLHTARQLAVDAARAGLADRLSCFYGYHGSESPRGSLPVLALSALRDADPDILIVCADREKESYLRAAEPYLNGLPRVIVAGYSHFEFQDARYYSILSKLDEPSLANGYPNSRIHLYQCLVNAARLGLRGVVVEFGMFRGGTTMFLSRTIEELGCDWQVIGFDTFEGFPARRSVFDMYDHKDLEAVDLAEVQGRLAHRNIRLVAGDLRDTIGALDGEQVVVAFVDTDNFSSAEMALGSIIDRVVPGGAIVFDHLTGVDRFVYTLGERMAAERLIGDARYFTLHDTGVFIRQCEAPYRP